MSDYVNEREKNVLDDPNLKLYGMPVGNSRRSPSMHFYYANNRPRIDVYTNVEDDSDDGKIRADLESTKDLDAFFAMVQRTIDNPATDFAHVMEVHESFFIKAENRYDEPKLRSKLVTGRDKEGRMFVALLSTKESRPKILFYFKAGRKHPFYKRGEKPNEIESSTIAAEGWLASLRRAYGYVIPTAYKHKEKQPPKGGKGGGGGYNRNSGGGGGNKDYYADDKGSNDDTGDNLPF